MPQIPQLLRQQDEAQGATRSSLGSSAVPYPNGAAVGSEGAATGFPSAAAVAGMDPWFAATLPLGAAPSSMGGAGAPEFVQAGASSEALSRYQGVEA